MQDIEDTIEKVLAMFDEEDIPYIKSEKYLDYLKQIKEKGKIKIFIKKLGEKYGSKRRRTME